MSETSLEARLEDMIMRHASETSVSVRLAFLITMQRHILYLTEQLDQEKESALANISDVMDVITAHHRGDIADSQVVAKLVELTGWEDES